VVGYYISEEQRAQEVITPGGGGDRVSYFSYRDRETALLLAIAAVTSTVGIPASGRRANLGVLLSTLIAELA
jgi:hypothetical protein